METTFQICEEYKLLCLSNSRVECSILFEGFRWPKLLFGIRSDFHWLALQHCDHRYVFQLKMLQALGVRLEHYGTCANVGEPIHATTFSHSMVFTFQRILKYLVCSLGCHLSWISLRLLFWGSKVYYWTLHLSW